MRMGSSSSGVEWKEKPTCLILPSAFFSWTKLHMSKSVKEMGPAFSQVVEQVIIEIPRAGLLQGCFKLGDGVLPGLAVESTPRFWWPG